MVDLISTSEKRSFVLVTITFRTPCGWQVVLAGLDSMETQSAIAELAAALNELAGEGSGGPGKYRVTLTDTRATHTN